MARITARAHGRPKGTVSLRIILHLLKERRRCTEIIASPDDCPDFQMPIDLFCYPLKLAILFQTSQIVPEILKGHILSPCTRNPRNPLYLEHQERLTCLGCRDRVLMAEGGPTILNLESKILMRMAVEA
jgi:hypothetical protein